MPFTVNVSVICDTRRHSTQQTGVKALVSTGCSSYASNKQLCHLFLAMEFVHLSMPSYIHVYNYKLSAVSVSVVESAEC